MSNLTLAELQAAVQNFLLDKSNNAENLTLETPAFPRSERLNIYYQAYRLRLIDAMRNDFPALEKYLGEEKFIELANDYITQHPSHNPSLRWLSEHVVKFLRTHHNWNKKLEWQELAAFEWAQVMVFDAPEEATVTIDNIRELPPDRWMNLRLVCHPAMQILQCKTNAPECWSSLIKDDKKIEFIRHKEIQNWLIWRDDLQVVYRPLNKPETWALETFSNQQTFADVCNGLCEWFEEEQVPMQAAQYLQQWIRSGLISELQ